MTDYPEQESHSVAARDVQAGQILWNPHGGSCGRMEVASDARERADGAIEFDLADGRTGLFSPRFSLQLDRPAMERAREELPDRELIPGIAGEIEPDRDGYKVHVRGREPVAVVDVVEALALLVGHAETEREAGS
jgi:hypothetical protein